MNPQHQNYQEPPLMKEWFAFLIAFLKFLFYVFYLKYLKEFNKCIQTFSSVASREITAGDGNRSWSKFTWSDLRFTWWDYLLKYWSPLPKISGFWATKLLQLWAPRKSFACANVGPACSPLAWFAAKPTRALATIVCG